MSSDEIEVPIRFEFSEYVDFQFSCKNTACNKALHHEDGHCIWCGTPTGFLSQEILPISSNEYASLATFSAEKGSQSFSQDPFNHVSSHFLPLAAKKGGTLTYQAYFCVNLKDPREYNAHNIVIISASEQAGRLVGLKPTDVGLQVKEIAPLSSIPLKVYHKFGEDLCNAVKESKSNPAYVQIVAVLKNPQGKYVENVSQLSVYLDSDSRPSTFFGVIKMYRNLSDEEAKKVGTTIVPAVVGEF